MSNSAEHKAIRIKMLAELVSYNAETLRLAALNLLTETPDPLGGVISVPVQVSEAERLIVEAATALRGMF